MTLLRPLYMQKADPGDPDIEYTAQEFREFADALLDEGRLGTGLLVSERGAGPNTSVDVAAGYGIVTGDDVARQGKYLIRNTATYNLVMPAKPAAGNNRKDIVIARVRDAQAGGGDNPADADWVIEYVAGAPVADPGVSVAPATPDSAIVLATVARTGAEASIADAAITDGTKGGFDGAVGLSGPTRVEGTLLVTGEATFEQDILVNNGGLTIDLDPADFLGRVLLNTANDRGEINLERQGPVAAADVIGRVLFRGWDSASALQDAGRIDAVSIDPTAASVDTQFRAYTVVASANAEAMRLRDKQVLGGGGDGTAVLPGVCPDLADPDTGIARLGANILGFSTAGVERARLDSSGITLAAAHYLLDSTGRLITYGAGPPEGAMTAPRGATYHDRTNGALYVKRTGTGNTGWERADMSRAVLTGFLHLASSIVTNTQLLRVRFTGAGVGGNAEPLVPDRAGSIVGIAAVATTDRTAGTMTFEVFKNGVATGLTCVLNGSTVRYTWATQAAGLDTFVAGDRLDVRATNAAYTPGAANFEASITIEFSE